MALETGPYISDLVVTNPAHTDGLNQTDSHIRLLKAAIKATFPNINGAVTLTDEQLNALLGRMLLPVDGTSAAPGYAFSSEPTLGIYRSSNGIITATGCLRPIQEIGMVAMFAAGTVPILGWAPCDGAEVARVGQYADLFARIGTTWGAGNGSTTFNLPDLRDRFPRHRGGSFSGVVGTLQSPQNLSHSHSVIGATASENQTHTHSFSGTTSSMNRNATHNHSGVAVSNNFYSSPGGATGVAQTINYGVTSTENTDHEHSFSGNTGAASQAHQHAINFTSGADGGSEARPYAASLLFCIRY